RYSGEYRDPSGEAWMPLKAIEISLDVETARTRLQKLDPATDADANFEDDCAEYKSAVSCSDQENVCTKQETAKSCIQWAGPIDGPHCEKWNSFTRCAKWEWVCVNRRVAVYCDKKSTKTSTKAPEKKPVPQPVPQKTAEPQKSPPAPAAADGCEGVRGAPRPGLNPVKLKAWLKCNAF
ncbi:MAG: hypothetical protein KDJ16_04710, partial [Hyphomicrobiales bacterium]|nr:hypothetical protein [Hyphomicrobiales bacterium]